MIVSDTIARAVSIPHGGIVCHTGALQEEPGMPTSTSLAPSPQLQSLFLDLVPEFIGPIIPAKILKLSNQRGNKKQKMV
jgi:hypothetical protein